MVFVGRPSSPHKVWTPQHGTSCGHISQLRSFSFKLRRMKIKAFLLAAVLLLATGAFAQDWALKALEQSPRHGEWVTIKAGDRNVSAFVVYPESKQKATVVIVIQEIFGMTDWVR